MSGTYGPLCALLLLLMGLQMTDGYENFATLQCEFNSTQPQDIVFINSYVYNKMEYARFDSRVNRFVGYTKYGVYNAERWNNDTAILERWRHQKETYCGNNIPIWYDTMLSKSVEPYAVLNSPPSTGQTRILVCSVYGFFPKHISVSWTNNKINITTGVTSTDLLPDGDWYYQLHSHLEYQPRSGDQISCVIEHMSLKDPLVLDWGGTLSSDDRLIIILASLGVVLGLVLSLAGFFFYKHRTKGYVLMPAAPETPQS
ncbi:hypothetical protein WMY93_031930 [Mugilogobius chulae]|uniref:Ig-like domain-containing protein n=1 Tax=Mugilogobius chulae TaxID=88201 RepID=A0AAW0MCQ3_9GOBI